MNFEILLDDLFTRIDPTRSLDHAENNFLLSLINDFENGGWRYTKFQNFIWDNIAETSLSHRERMSLLDHSHSSLVASAQNLRLTDGEDDIGRGSELAEIVLYGIMKWHYNALPVVPKIFYKQNTQDNAKGADSVHITLDDDGDFSLWLGEAKFYNSIEDARLQSIVTSISNLLSPQKLKKENAIITNVCDLDELEIDPLLRERIKAVLSSDASLDDLKPRLHVPILLLHECGLTQNCDQLTDEYKRKIIEHHKDRTAAYFTKHLAELTSIFLYDKIRFHVILFPVPQKKPIVERFLANIAHYKGQ
jgi:hypothetical protein